jgi:hypothetical protein
MLIPVCLLPPHQTPTDNRTINTLPVFMLEPPPAGARFPNGASLLAATHLPHVMLYINTAPKKCSDADINDFPTHSIPTPIFSIPTHIL